MNTLPAWQTAFGWLVNHSLQAGLLVVLVLAVQWLFRRRLTSRWRFALWWIVLARLLLPVEPESALSLFNVFQSARQVAVPDHSAAASPAQSLVPTASVSARPPRENEPPAGNPATPMVAPNLSFPGQPETGPLLSRPAMPVPAHSFVTGNLVLRGLTGLWLAGVLALSGIVLVQAIIFHRKLRSTAIPAGLELQELLAECQHEFGRQRPITLLETTAVDSPALFGLLRLRLLLPRGIRTQFTAGELRYIFLHELAHVKRLDPWLNWLVTILQIFHWFNPLLWFGFARLRADRELACDELALLRAGDRTGTAYGETVIKLLENLNRPKAIPGLVGILEDKKQMRRRISTIADFHRPGRWSMLAVVLVAVLAAAALTDAQTGKPTAGSAAMSPEMATNNSAVGTVDSPERPDLAGVVSGPDGAALPVPATVFIATAGPKTGSSTFCPSCYADCAKHATTEAQGKFRIKSLDPELRFQILAVAKGYQPKFVPHIDPAKDGPVKIELAPIEATDAAPDHSLRGRVVDAKGAPIAGAEVDMQGVETRDGGGRWGSLSGIDPLAVTDTNGDFLLTAKTPFEMMDLQISARGFATKNFNKIASGMTVHEMNLTEGATVTGRVIADGKPLAGVSVGVSATDRSMPNYLGHFEVATDAQGRFNFFNLPPNTDFQIYTLMDTMKKYGATSLAAFRTATDGGSTDVGDMPVTAAHRLAGRVILADGSPVPAGTRLLISRGAAWDSMEVMLDPDGHFEAAGLPSEIISLSARVPGYHVSTRNVSLDQMNPYQLSGQVNHDLTQLQLLMEKGPAPAPDYSNVDPNYNARELTGAEGIKDHSADWLASGHVVDADTQQPIADFQVTLGHAENYDQPSWNTLQAVDGSNGVYTTYFSRRTSQPLLKIEADGYLPQVTNPPAQDATGIDFALHKGIGPAGTVLTAAGKPAAHAHVVLMGDGMNQAYLMPNGEIENYGRNRPNLGTTDADGRFAFKPVWGVKYLAATTADGFAFVNLAALATNPVVTLAPYGKVTGTLQRKSGPGTNEDLDLFLTDESVPGMSRLSLNQHVFTDLRGRFEFDHVPPANLQISFRDHSMTGNLDSWQNITLQNVRLQPGQSLLVNIVTGDRPPPPKVSPYQPPPLPKIIPGVRLKGIVLAPDGKPATDADVALQVDGVYLGLGKGTLTVNADARSEGFLVTVGADGSFTLPMCDGAQSVIALNEAGYAQVSLSQVKATHQITLQKWGRVEGVLHIGRQLGSNQVVRLASPLPVWAPRIDWEQPATRPPGTTNAQAPVLPPPNYDTQAFSSQTDDRGHFVITFVPPGRQSLWRQVPYNAGPNSSSWNETQLGTVDVKPGEMVITNLGGTGRAISGKVKFIGGGVTNFPGGSISVSTPMKKIYEKIAQLKTDEERKEFYQSPEYVEAFANRRSFSARVSPDGSFSMADVIPGKYDVQFQRGIMDEATGSTTEQIFTSEAELNVPPASDKNDDSVVNWGTVELKLTGWPKPKT